VTHGQCDVRPTVTVPSAAGHHRPLTVLHGDGGTCVWTTCPRLLLENARSGVKPATVESQVQRPNHYTTHAAVSVKHRSGVCPSFYRSVPSSIYSCVKVTHQIHHRRGPIQHTFRLCCMMSDWYTCYLWGLKQYFQYDSSKKLRQSAEWGSGYPLLYKFFIWICKNLIDQSGRDWGPNPWTPRHAVFYQSIN